MKELVHIAFIGAGMISTGLGACCVSKGFRISFRNPERSIPRAQNEMERILRFYKEQGILSEETYEQARFLYTITPVLEDAVCNADLIIEGMPENLSLKQSLYSDLEKLVPTDTVIASTSSRFTAGELSKGMSHPERFMVAHPWHPSYLLPLIELMGSTATSPEAIASAKSFFEQIGKEVVVCRHDMSGCLGNEISWTISNIAKKYVKDGICSAEDIDRVIMYGAGLRLAATGQLLTISLGTPGGLRNYAAKFHREPEPSIELVADSVDQEMASRTAEEGQTWEECAAYRDKMIVKFLRAKSEL